MATGSTRDALTDGMMPGMPVGELVSRLRSAEPRPKIVLMSGYAGEAFERSGVLSPDTPFLQKPFTSSDLLQKVRGALDAKSAA